MEDIDEEEPIVDIDSVDKKNSLAVTEYIDELYTFYKKAEVKYLSMYFRNFEHMCLLHCYFMYIF